MTTTVHHRAYGDEADFWRVRDLLVTTFSLTRKMHNWEIRRWEGKRFYHDPDDDPAHRRAFADSVHLWETDGGVLIGAAIIEGDGEVHLQVHPDFRLIEDEMLDWAEAHCALASENGGHPIGTWVYEWDTYRQEVVTRRGFEKTQSWSVIRWRSLDETIPAPTLPPGYTLRTLCDDEADFERMAVLLNAAFNRTFMNAAQSRGFTHRAPCYRFDSDFVVVAPDGTFAATAGVIYDTVNRFGLFEPVCTHPNHQRQGLARAAMQAGLRKMQALGAGTAYVSTGDMIPANALYEAVGFSQHNRLLWWQKRIPG